MFGLLWIVSTAASEETRSMIFGRVLDPQSSAVVGAAVIVTNTDTNTSLTLQANETGYYAANLLPPGQYQVTAEAAGGKKSVRSGIVLPISTRSQANIQLELGGLAEIVTVTGEAPVLDTTTAASGQIIDNTSIMQLPVVRNNPLTLAYFVPGIQVRGSYMTSFQRAASITMGTIHTPNNVGGFGVEDASNDLLIDGVPNFGRNRRIAFMPHSDEVEEFKVETSGFDASQGHAVGVNVSLMTKAGTNQFHGSATEEHAQQRWGATPFFNKQAYYRAIAQAVAAGDSARADYLRSQPSLPSGRLHDYGVTIGGPVILPKIYNGRNKLFFFFGVGGIVDGATESSGEMINNTLPTMANRQGDFSQLLKVDPVRYQIYDPLSVRPDPARPTHYIRDPIQGNILSPSRIINPVYSCYSKLLPKPNNDPVNPTLEPLNNYVTTAEPFNFNYKAFTNRVDYHASKHRFFGQWNWSDGENDRADWTYESAPHLHGDDNVRHNTTGTVDWVYTPSSRTMLDVAVGANQYTEGQSLPVSKSYKPSDVGLPAYMDAKAGAQHHIPVMSTAGYKIIGLNYVVFVHTRAISSKADFSHIHGNHTLRAGFDTRQFFQTGGGGNTSGNFSFDSTFTRRNDDTFTPAGFLGLSWAAFMMGYPSSLSVATNDSYATYTPMYGWFAQDNWRVTPRLSLTLGLRLEYEQGMTESYNRMLGYFDPSLTLSIANAAQAAYAKSPVPELPASQFLVQGGTVYAGVRGAPRNVWQSELMWLPRAAAAFQLNSKTVLRAGYRIFCDTLNVSYITPNQFGFSQTTSTNVTNDFGVTWLAGNPQASISPMSDPFPVRPEGTRFDAPYRDALGAMAQAGRSYSYNGYGMKHARRQRWRAGVQRELFSRTVVDVAYAGAWSDHVLVSQKLDPLPASYWADGMVRNDAIASNLNANVPNPFALKNSPDLQRTDPLLYQNLSALGYFTSSTIAKNQLLRAFPQISSLTNSRVPVGKARSDALELSLSRRFSKGFNLNVGYTRLRARTADLFYDEFDPLPSWRPTNYGVPNRLTATGVYELPFGKGRPFLKAGILSWVLGGFRLGATYEYQTVLLLDFSNLFYYGNLGDIASGPQTLDHWFNTDNFERSSSKAPAAFQRRVFPTRVDNVRGDMMNVWNLNAQQDFPLTETVRMEVRMDALNAMNRTIFNVPSANPLSSDFAKVTGVTDTSNRKLQLQARIRFGRGTRNC